MLSLLSLQRGTNSSSVLNVNTGLKSQPAVIECNADVVVISAINVVANTSNASVVSISNKYHNLFDKNETLAFPYFLYFLEE